MQIYFGGSTGYRLAMPWSGLLILAFVAVLPYLMAWRDDDERKRPSCRSLFPLWLRSHGQRVWPMSRMRAGAVLIRTAGFSAV
jgi:hypothetical protein